MSLSEFIVGKSCQRAERLSELVAFEKPTELVEDREPQRSKEVKEKFCETKKKF